MAVRGEDVDHAPVTMLPVSCGRKEGDANVPVYEQVVIRIYGQIRDVDEHLRVEGWNGPYRVAPL